MIPTSLLPTPLRNCTAIAQGSSCRLLDVLGREEGGGLTPEVGHHFRRGKRGGGGEKRPPFPIAYSIRFSSPERILLSFYSSRVYIHAPPIEIIAFMTHKLTKSVLERRRSFGRFISASVMWSDALFQGKTQKKPKEPTQRTGPRTAQRKWTTENPQFPTRPSSSRPHAASRVATRF
jgi:hypothetical protein